MRVKLNLKINSSVFGNRLPINYQYELSVWIYGIIAQGDQHYAEWLHQNGFSEKYRKHFIQKKLKFGKKYLIVS